VDPPSNYKRILRTIEMTTPVPLDMFSADVLPEERIEWTGQPNPKVILHAEDWTLIPFSLLWGGFAIFWLLGASGVWDIFASSHPNHPFQYFGVIWGTPFVVVGQYLIWGRFVYARWKKRRTFYALTNRRALIIQSGIKGRTSSSAYFENLSIVEKRVRSDGIGIISFGGPVTGEWQWGRNNSPRPPTFDDIDQADFVHRTAIKLLDQARKPATSTASRWPT
jgi:hypothetical protein